MAEPTIMWPGVSGREYKYWIYTMGTTFNNETGGNYIFAKQTSPGKWVPIYIGETNNIKDRLSSAHEKLPCVNHNGGTHLHVHLTSAGERARKAEEADLIAKWNPPCNK